VLIAFKGQGKNQQKLKKSKKLKVIEDIKLRYFLVFALPKLREYILESLS